MKDEDRKGNTYFPIQFSVLILRIQSVPSSQYTVFDLLTHIYFAYFLYPWYLYDISKEFAYLNSIDN